MAAKDHFWVHLQPESEGYLVGKIQLPTDDRIGLECLAKRRNIRVGPTSERFPMNLQDFFSLILSPNGCACIATLNGKYFTHFVVPNSDAATKVEQLVAREQDVYFAVGTLKDTSYISPEGKEFVRAGPNIHEIKSFILDLDVKDKDDCYATQRDACLDIKRFCKETGLPTPTVVNSGNGIHAYWPLETPLPAEEWVKHAKRFKALLTIKKVKQDPARTADRASVLRPPATFNYKERANPKAVEVIHAAGPFPNDDFLAKLDKACDAASLPKTAKVTPTRKAIMEVGLGELLPATELVSGKKVHEKCAQLQKFAAARGDVSEPLWYANLGLIRFFKNGRAIAHKASSGHPKYDPAETDRKLDQLENKSIGPTTCDKFASLCDACKGCPFAGSIKSPVVLGREINEIEYNKPETTEVHTETGAKKVVERAYPTPPPAYKFGQGNKLWHVQGSTDKNGNFTESITIICDTIFFPVKTIRTGNSLSIRFVARFQKDGWREFTMNAKDISSHTDTLSQLADVGILCTRAQAELVHTYTILSVQLLMEREQSKNAYAQMGWQEDDCFVVGDVSYKPDGTIETDVAPDGLRNIADKFDRKGELSVWSEAIDTMYNRKGCEAYQSMLLIGGFGAPLLKFTGYNGGILNFVGDRGTGKSTILQAIMSIFGTPAYDILQISDTVKSKEHLLGVFGSLPITHDEITNIEPDKLSALAYAITGGRSNHRLNQDSSLRKNESSWQLILSSTSNESLHQKLAQAKSNPSAESVRVFELYSPPHDALPISKRDADLFIRGLGNNHGVAGSLYGAYLAKNRHLIATKMTEMQDRIDELMGGYSGERFWAAQIAAGMVGGEIASELGLIKFNLERTLEYLLKCVKKMRAKVDEFVQTPVDVLVEFMNARVNEQLVVAEDQHPSKIVFPLRTPSNAVTIRIVTGTGKAYISSRSIMAYCSEIHADFSTVKQHLFEEGVIVNPKKQVSLAANTNIGGGRSWCWEINMHHPAVSDMLTSNLSTNVQPIKVA